MRAKTINFERGQEPFDAIGIGRINERKIAKIHGEITQAIIEIARELGIVLDKHTLQDKTGKNRISIGFEYANDYYYITFDLDDIEANEYSVGWHKTTHSSETRNGDEIYPRDLEGCITQLKYWLGITIDPNEL